MLHNTAKNINLASLTFGPTSGEYYNISDKTAICIANNEPEFKLEKNKLT